MAKIVYHIVQHDGGWAYRVNETFSEPFPTHDDARKAAAKAAAEQQVPGSTTEIIYEDPQGHWHDEQSKGDDRPETSVEG
jgi:hypothetical protein